MAGLRAKLESPRLEAQLNSVLRIDVIEGYTEAWMRMISQASGHDLSYSIKILPDAIQMRLVKEIEVAFKSGTEYRADVIFKYDWEQFKMEVHKNGERMVIDDGGIGNLPSSMVGTIVEAEEIVAAVWKSTEADNVEIWLTFDEDAVAKYGRDEIRRRLDTVQATDAEVAKRAERKFDIEHKFLEPSTSTVIPSMRICKGRSRG